MGEKDDLILTTLMQLKEDTAVIREKTEQQEGCIRQLTDDVTELKKNRDEVSGGLKVVAVIGTGAGAAAGWLAAHFPGLK